MRSLLLAILIFSSLQSWGAQAFSTEMQYLMSKYNIEDGFQGNILIKRGKYTLFQGSIGLANREHQVAHTSESKFLIASVSKQFTAALLFVLSEKYEFSIDDPISSYFAPKDPKAKPDYWGHITLRHLLTHTSGATRDVPVSASAPRSNRNYLSNLVGRILTERGFSKVRELGKDFYYSNAGYVLVAEVIEQVCRMSFENCLNKHLLKPLGLSDTGVYHRMKILNNQAEGYYKADGRGEIFRRCCIDATNLIGSHSMYSTASDLTRWTKFIHSNEESSVFSLESRKNLVESQVFDMGQFYEPKVQYAHGLFVDTQSGVKRVWHDGNTAGYLSVVSYFPEKDISVVILSNYHGDLFGEDDFFNYRMHDEIADIIAEM